MARFGTSRLFGKFILRLLPVFLIASALGLALISSTFQRTERNELAARIGGVSARATTAIARLGPASTPDQTNALLNLLLADNAILCAEIIAGDGKSITAVPAGPKCRQEGRRHTIDLSIRYPAGARLHVTYTLAELETSSQALRDFALLALVFGAVIATATSWLAFRFIVGRPVGNLLAAIEQTERSGTFVKTRDPPDDELGVVMRAFNNMQECLADQAARNAAALERFDRLYNETPALMFALAQDGTLQSVSGHLLEITGYDRDEIIGQPLSLLVSHGKEATASQPVSSMLTMEHCVRDLPLRLYCKNGRWLDVLLSSISGRNAGEEVHLCVLSDVTGLRAAELELQHQAVTDHLTGLANRKGLYNYLVKIGQPSNAAILFIDLDKFKSVNDSLGHEAGDTLLRATASRIRNTVQANDFLARLGGDEFALVVHDLRDKDSPRAIGERILAALAAPFQIGVAQATIGASIGIADFSDRNASAEDVLRYADLAMYKSKQSGRNCISVYTPDLNKVVMRRDRVTKKIREAIQDDHLRLFLQPIVDLDSLSPVGAEALLRLDCPKDGLLSPAEVIRTAEETGHMAQLGQWIVNEGLSLGEDCLPLFGQSNSYISINLSPTQLDWSGCGAIIDRLNASRHTASSIVFEITETAFLKQDESVSEILAEIRRTGARIALDDFGTGYSTLGHIQRFEVDILKIDRIFVNSLTQSEAEARKRGQALIRATGTLARDLGIQVIAEGIENMETLEALRSLGIHSGQGYLFSPPMPLPSFAGWIAGFGRTQLETPRRLAG